MSQDVHERLREKTLQIAHLQQQLGALQAQLDGTRDIIEQKLARGGVLVFQMRKTADVWKKKAIAT